MDEDELVKQALTLSLDDPERKQHETILKCDETKQAINVEENIQTDVLLEEKAESSSLIVLEQKQILEDCPKNAKDAHLKQTGLVYDERMTQYSCVQMPSHVERPARVTSIYNKLLQSGFVDRCKIIDARFATEDEVLLKHNWDHYEVIKSVENKTQEELESLSMSYDSVYFHPAVTECSLLAAGSVLEIVDHVLQGNILNGAAVTRPPGHHALSHCSMGFCHFNNVALAAMFSIMKYNLQKVLIVDWDVHYGNGNHKMFESDPRVLHFSMHRYDNNRFWPCLKEGNYDAVGIGDGEGYNIHVAWNKKGMGDTDYLLAFDNILLPVAEEYQPELILVSAGFDSGKGDPLGGCNVTPAGYAHMTKKLTKLAGGKVVIVLEGGYNLTTISDSMAACVATLLGDDIPPLMLEAPSASAINSIANTLFAVKKYWESLSVIDDMFINIKPRVGSESDPESSSSGEESSDKII